MTTTTGERTFSTSGRSVQTQTFKLIPPGTHNLRIAGDASIAKADKPDAVPYINLSMEVLGTASTEGGKNQRVFHRLFLGLNLGKDGVANVDRENGLVAMAQSMGTEVEGVEIVEREATNADGNTVKLEYLNPKQVTEWLAGFVGTEVRARIKTEKGTGGYSDKSVIAKFLLSES